MYSISGGGAGPNYRLRLRIKNWALNENIGSSNCKKYREAKINQDHMKLVRNFTGEENLHGFLWDNFKLLRLCFGGLRNFSRYVYISLLS